MTNPERCPAVLVHGWRSHPGIWRPLLPRLSDAAVSCWNFDHTAMQNAGTEAIAIALRDYIHAKREETGYSGPVDLVCHSMGTCIARYLLEVLDGDAQEEKVRLLVGIGPPNNGSSMAELFNDPEMGPEVIRSLAGVFVPRDYDPQDDTIVQEFRPRSRTVATLRAAGTRDDVAYRIILTANLTATPAFFPAFSGRTWELTRDGEWRTTYAGDGIVPHADSYLPGAGLDILPRDPGSLAWNPEYYSHTWLPRNPEVITRITEYLCNPDTVPCGISPAPQNPSTPILWAFGNQSPSQ
ncbi:MAG TPA: alpha/beta fold hydrolase [Candidatus Methanoculleus thermohydrogenotrophicum]|nr:alpha/beta fold hydrolase [Candidatus Methanoculleus thermohydrogenotrophicum]HPZ38059.1 alpha/beta fold hydrolase [Candidatus Methanoculleus thermohydrogenotrophicum]HQC91510.1 alpha/beta fold hydrolase [Candidatus Methanoculleus thermohydrogenotrophicum]